MSTHLHANLHTLLYVPLIVGISAAAGSAAGVLGSGNKLNWKEMAIMGIIGTTMGTYFAITGNSIRYGLSQYWR